LTNFNKEMRENIKLQFLLIFAVIMFSIQNINAQRAVVPHSENFDPPYDFNYWEIGDDEVPVFMFDNITIGDLVTGASNTFNIGYAALKMDLSNTSNVNLDFDWRWSEYSNNYTCDGVSDSFVESVSGVFFSDDDGETYKQVYVFEEHTWGSWQNITLDISALAAQNDISLNNEFVIKFQ